MTSAAKQTTGERREFECSTCGYEFSSWDPQPQCRQCLQRGRVVTATIKRATAEDEYKCPSCGATFSSEDPDPQCLYCLQRGHVVTARRVKPRFGLTVALATFLALLAFGVISGWISHGVVDYQFEDRGLRYQVVRLACHVLLLVGVGLYFVLGIRRAKTKQIRDTLLAIALGFGCLALLRVLGG